MESKKVNTLLVMEDFKKFKSIQLNEKDRINIDDGEKALIVNLIDGIRINFCPICGREFKNDI